MIQDKLQLPDRPDLKAGLKNTIAVYGRSNQLTIYHERGPEGHADEIDAVSGSIYEATREEKQEDVAKLLDDMSDKVKDDMRIGRSKRLSAQYDEEMGSEAGEDWGGASGSTPRGDW
jgi:hypothetical protein